MRVEACYPIFSPNRVGPRDKRLLAEDVSVSPRARNPVVSSTLRLLLLLSYAASWLSIGGILAGRGGLDVGLRRQVEQVGRFCFSRSRKPLKGKGRILRRAHRRARACE